VRPRADGAAWTREPRAAAAGAAPRRVRITADSGAGRIMAG